MIPSSGNFHLQGRSVIEGYVTTCSGSTTSVNPFADALDDFLKNSIENHETLFEPDWFPIVDKSEIPVVSLNSPDPLSEKWLEESIRYSIYVLPAAILLPLILSDYISNQSALFSAPLSSTLGSAGYASISDLGLITDDTSDIGIDYQDNDYIPLHLDDLFTPFSLDPLSDLDMMLTHDLNLSGILVL